MPLTLNFNIDASADCKSLIFTETTGTWGNINNPNGWIIGAGGTNQHIINATLASLIITDPDGIPSASIPLAGFPSATQTKDAHITSIDLYNTTTAEVLKDGIYEFVYTVTSSVGADVTQTIRYYNFCSSKGAVYSLFGDLAANKNINQDVKIAKALKAFAFYQSLVYAAGTEQEDKFTDLQTIITEIITEINC